MHVNNTVKSPVFWIHFIATGIITFAIASLIPHITTFQHVGLTSSLLCLTIPIGIISLYHACRKKVTPTPIEQSVILQEKEHPQAQLTYDEFCDYSSMGNEGYAIIKGKEDRYDQRESYWHQWVPMFLNEACKFHLSIKAEHMAQAFAIVFPYLLKYEVTGFKIMGKYGLTRNHPSDRNLKGKEFVVYLTMKDVEEGKIDLYLQEMFVPIITALIEARIEFGEVPLGDLPVKGGKRFLFFRSQPKNSYVRAEDLAILGFARTESALFGGQTQLPPFENLPEIQWEVDAIYVDDSLSLPKKIQRYWFNAQENQELVQLTFYQFLSQKNYHIKNFLCFYGWGESYPLRREALIYYFNTCSDLVERACQSLDASKDWGKHRFSIIMPALYYHFIIPFNQLVKEGRINLDTANLQRPFEAFPDLEKKLMIEMVRCSFRVRGQQPACLYPTYIPELAKIPNFDDWVNELMNSPNV